MYIFNENTFSFYLGLYVIFVNLLNETSGYNKQIFVSLEDVVNQTCFSTHGWPNSYENDFYQIWHFDQIIFHTHKIQFTILALDSELYYDTFKIYEGKTLIKSYSGTITSNQTIYSEVGQRPSAYFISDSSVTGKGVKFCVKLVPAENVAQLAANAVRSVTNEVLNLGYWNDTRCGDYTPPDCTDRENEYYDLTELCLYDTPDPVYPDYFPEGVGIYKAFQTTPFLYLVQIINVGDIYVHSWFQTIHNIETLVITSGFNGTMSIGDFFVKYFVYQIYGRNKPSICQVYFVMGSQSTWGSQFPEHIDLSIVRIATAQNSYFSMDGAYSNILTGYFLLSRKSGQEIPQDEVTDALEVAVAAMSIDSAPFFSLSLDTFAEHFASADITDKIKDNYNYNYAVDIVKLANTFSGSMIDFEDSTGSASKAMYNTIYRYKGFSFTSIAKTGSPLIGWMWINETNTQYTLKVSWNSRPTRGSLIFPPALHTKDTTIKYAFNEMRNNSFPTACEVYFTITSPKWNTSGQPLVSFRSTFDDTTFNLTDSSNVMFGYMLLTKEPGYSIDRAEVENTLEILATAVVLENAFDQNMIGRLQDAALSVSANIANAVSPWFNPTFSNTNPSYFLLNDLYDQTGNMILPYYNNFLDSSNQAGQRNFVIGSSIQFPFLRLMWITSEGLYKYGFRWDIIKRTVQFSFNYSIAFNGCEVDYYATQMLESSSSLVEVFFQMRSSKWQSSPSSSQVNIGRRSLYYSFMVSGNLKNQMLGYIDLSPKDLNQQESMEEETLKSMEIILRSICIAMDELYGYLPSPSNVSSTTPIPDTTMHDKFTTPIPVFCPTECEGCIGPCLVNSNGGCNCNCIIGYFPTEMDCQPVLCKKETILHPTLLINVTFPETQTGFKSSSLEKCDDQTVNGGKPYGTRSCLLNGTSTTPIWLTSCDVGIQNLTVVVINSTEQRESVANDLEVLTFESESLDSKDVSDTVEALNNVLDAPSLTPQTSSSVVTTVSNLMDVPDDVLTSSGQTDQLLVTLESVGETVELDENGVYQEVSSNVGIAVLLSTVDQGRSGLGVSFLPIDRDLGFRSDQVNLFSDDVIPNDVKSYITVPNSAALQNGSPKRISFHAYPNSKIFLSPNETYYDVNSIVVLSASVEKTSVNNLVDPVIVQLLTNRSLNNGSEVETSVCVYWDEMNKIWSGNGSTEIKATDNITVCHFDHLTNFATLLARGESAESVNRKSLDIVSLVGSSISIFCLCLTILSFICVPKLRVGGKIRVAVLLINLSVALLLLNLLLILSEQNFVYSSKDSCLAVGVLLHFSLLASFAWMMVEAANVCLITVAPFYNRSHVTDQKVFILSNIWGWFVPSLFVAITCGVDLTIYQRSDKECWMKPNMIPYLVVIPLFVVFAFNIVAYFAVIYTTVVSQVIRKESTAGRRRLIIQQVVLSLSLFVLLGLFWAFGFGITGSDDNVLVFGVIFAILNSLQGVFIFALFIVRNKTAREEMKIQAKNLVNMAQQATADFMSNSSFARTKSTTFDATWDNVVSSCEDVKT